MANGTNCINCSQWTYNAMGFCSDDCQREHREFMEEQAAHPPEDTPCVDQDWLDDMRDRMFEDDETMDLDCDYNGDAWDHYDVPEYPW